MHWAMPQKPVPSLHEGSHSDPQTLNSGGECTREAEEKSRTGVTEKGCSLSLEDFRKGGLTSASLRDFRNQKF